MTESVEEESTQNEPTSSAEQAPTSSEGEFKIIDADATETAPATLENPVFAPYNAEQFHDQARKHIAVSLLCLLAAVILVFEFGLLLLCPKPTFEQYKSILEMLLTPILTLVSAATGFYFGSKK